MANIAQLHNLLKILGYEQPEFLPLSWTGTAFLDTVSCVQFYQ